VHRQYFVVDSNGLEIRKVDKEQIKRMVRRGQAVMSADGRVYRLVTHGKSHQCRTHISSGGERAAMGMSQDYVVTERGQSRFKTIYPEDKPAFTLDALFRDDPYDTNTKRLSATGFG
jgi:hypothetical protein